MERGEEALVEAAKKDPAHFAALYEAHFERIYAFVAARLRDRSAAEDVTAEVFRQALASIGGFEWRGIAFSAWLYRIAVNEIADHRWKAARERGNPVSGEPGGQEMEAVERRVTLFGLVESLPADQRRVIVMRFAEGKSIGEVGAEMGRSDGAVKQLQWRALQSLRSRLGTRHG